MFTRLLSCRRRRDGITLRYPDLESGMTAVRHLQSCLSLSAQSVRLRTKPRIDHRAREAAFEHKYLRDLCRRVAFRSWRQKQWAGTL